MGFGDSPRAHLTGDGRGYAVRSQCAHGSGSDSRRRNCHLHDRFQYHRRSANHATIERGRCTLSLHSNDGISERSDARTVRFQFNNVEVQLIDLLDPSASMSTRMMMAYLMSPIRLRNRSCNHLQAITAADGSNRDPNPDSAIHRNATNKAVLIPFTPSKKEAVHSSSNEANSNAVDDSSRDHMHGVHRRPGPTNQVMNNDAHPVDVLAAQVVSTSDRTDCIEKHMGESPMAFRRVR